MLRVIKFLIIALFVFASSNAAYAQLKNNAFDKSVHQRAIDLALQIEAEISKTEDPLATQSIADRIETNDITLAELRDIIIQRLDGSVNYDIDKLFKVYENTARDKQSSADLALLKYYKSFAFHYDPFEKNKTNKEKALQSLDDAMSHENWIVRHQAYSLSSFLYAYENNFSLALQAARNSLATIPSETNPDTQYAKHYSYSSIAYLYSVTKNPELALDAYEALVSMTIRTEKPLDAIDYLNNIIFAFNSWGEDTLTLALIEILLRVEANKISDTPGLAYLRAAKANIGMGRFEKALDHINKSLAVATHPKIQRNLRLHEIQALAGSGEQKLALKKYAQFKLLLTQKDKNSIFIQRELALIDALIAVGEDRSKAAYMAMHRYNNLSVQPLLKANSSDTASLLANLENDKVRQQEREAMLAMEQKNRLRMWAAALIIMAFILAAAIAYAIFASYRGRTAQKLTDAAEAALAGEKAKSQFLAVISHELRTPLNGIIGIADLLSRTAPTEDLRRKISIVNDSGHDLLKLVEQVLDMSRIDANEMEIFPEYTPLESIIESIDTLWRPTIENKDVIFTTHLDASVPNRIMVDPMRLRQCINNLISNASKFTHEGRIHMHIAAEPVVGTDTVTLRVIVADTGIGMSEEVAGNLFRPFVQADSSITRQYGGSGLGLAITRSLARMMDGDLTVITRKGAGTEFTFTLQALAAHDTDIMESVDAVFKNIDSENMGFEDESKGNVAATNKDEAAINDIDIIINGSHSNGLGYQPSKDAGLDMILGEFPDTRLSNTSPHTRAHIRNTGVGDALVDISAAVHSAPDRFDNNARNIPIPPPTRIQAPISKMPLPQTIDEANMDSLENLRVLIVEDVPSNHDVMKIFLEPQGCLVMGAENGIIAVSTTSKQEFDVILMDIRMPEMDGIEATKAIRARGGLNAHVPIIALTADATAETNAQCMAAGADIFLTKPLIATELYDAIRFVRRQALRRAIRSGAVKPSPIIRVEDDRRSA